MKFILNLISNEVLITSALSWLTAGFFKVFIELILNKRLMFSRIIGSGGMPSSHTATVVALCVSVAYVEGVASSLFALTVMFAIIVIHDAVGVRFETGKQAKILNLMMFETEAFKNLDFESKLKEYVGHTPFQVIVGAMVGAFVSFVMMNYVYV